MQTNLSIKKPCTVYVKFETPPGLFQLKHERHGLYYFRDLQGKTPRIKFNICHPGQYTANIPFEIVKVVPIEIPDTLPGLPSYERNDIKDFVINDNFDFYGSPARVFVKEGIIERSKDFYKLPKPIRVFILLHEVGHFFYGITDADIKKANRLPEPDNKDFLRKRMYESEAKCDLFALVQYLQMGYNRSMAYYSLSKVLSRSQDNIDRVKKLVSNIQKTQSNAITS